LTVSAISPDGTTVLTAAPAAGVHVWDVSERGGAEVAHLPADDEGHPGIAWSPDAGRLAVSAGDGDVALWDTTTWSDQTVVSPGGIVDNIAWSPDGALIATASDGRATVWDANDRREVFAVAYGDDFGSVAWDPDGDNLAVVGYRQAIVVDRGGAEVARITAVPGLPEGVAFDRTGSLLGLAYELGDIAIWDWRAGELVWDDVGEFSNLAFDPTSARVVAAAVGGRSRVIEVPDGSVLAELRGQAAGVQHAAFSPDGGLIATAGFDATVRLWDAETGAELLVLRGHDGLVHRVAFSPDGRWLASSSPADGVRVWALDVDELLTIAREKVTRGFTAQECVQYLGGEPCE
jgi:WD40 repeat protein